MGKFPIARRHVPIRFHAEQGGQSVVLVALMFVVLMGGAAMSIDVGRFYAERRFIQGAVDAAALACAISWARTNDAATAWAAGDAVLQQRNLNHNPLGLTLTYEPRGSELYENYIVADQNLISGILPTSNTSGRGCRVAITVAVPTYLIKIVTPALNTISLTTRAYAKAKGGFLPSVIKRYLNQSDTDGVDTGSGNEFVDTTAQAGTEHLCSVGSDYAPGCQAATTANPGPTIVLFGASQTAENDSSFRGYIGLDIRNFSDADPPNSSNLIHAPYNYNGVAADATVNTLKDFEANWITAGYPGPDICVVDSVNVAKCAQIAAINGSSSGIFVDYYNQFFRPGDIGMFQLYDGTVKSVPDFTFTPPTLTVPTSGGSIPSKTVPFSFSAQFRLTTSTICTDIIPDNGTYTEGPGDASGKNPFIQGHININSSGGSCTGDGHGNFSSNPTPSGLSSYDQTWSGMTATGAQQGIYVVFLRGTASTPFAGRTHVFPATVNVGNQVIEYTLSGSTTQLSVSSGSLPLTVSWQQQVGTNSGPRRWQTTGASADGSITVSWEQCPKSSDGVQLVCYIGTPGVTSTTTTAGNNVNVTASTLGVTATPKTYYGWVRFMGIDHNNHPVVKLQQVRLDVDLATGGTTQYIDVIGYAGFEITSMDSNDVYGRAVTGAYLDPNDPALAIGKKIVLVPWETP